MKKVELVGLAGILNKREYNSERRRKHWFLYIHPKQSVNKREYNSERRRKLKKSFLFITIKSLYKREYNSERRRKQGIGKKGKHYNLLTNKREYNSERRRKL